MPKTTCFLWKRKWTIEQVGDRLGKWSSDQAPFRLSSLSQTWALAGDTNQSAKAQHKKYTTLYCWTNRFARLSQFGRDDHFNSFHIDCRRWAWNLLTDWYVSGSQHMARGRFYIILGYEHPDEHPDVALFKWNHDNKPWYTGICHVIMRPSMTIGWSPAPPGPMLPTFRARLKLVRSQAILRAVAAKIYQKPSENILFFCVFLCFDLFPTMEYGWTIWQCGFRELVVFSSWQFR